MALGLARFVFSGFSCEHHSPFVGSLAMATASTSNKNEKQSFQRARARINRREHIFVLYTLAMFQKIITRNGIGMMRVHKFVYCSYGVCMVFVIRSIRLDRTATNIPFKRLWLKLKVIWNYSKTHLRLNNNY